MPRNSCTAVTSTVIGKNLGEKLKARLILDHGKTACPISACSSSRRGGCRGDIRTAKKKSGYFESCTLSALQTNAHVVNEALPREQRSFSQDTAAEVALYERRWWWWWWCCGNRCCGGEQGVSPSLSGIPCIWYRGCQGVSLNIKYRNKKSCKTAEIALFSWLPKVANTIILLLLLYTGTELFTRYISIVYCYRRKYVYIYNICNKQCLPQARLFQTVI